MCAGRQTYVGISKPPLDTPLTHARVAQSWEDRAGLRFSQFEGALRKTGRWREKRKFRFADAGQA